MEEINRILDQHGGDCRKAAEAIYNEGPEHIRLEVLKIGLKQLAKLQRRHSR